MRDSLEKALTWIIWIEGGLVDDRDDPGGLTKYGISKKAYPDLDIKSLTIDDAKAIYKRDYWDACGCDNIPTPLDIYVFDSAVNCGVSKAKAFMTNALNSAEYLMNRMDYYIEISRKNANLQKFFRGWIIRLSKLRTLGTMGRMP